MNDAKSPDRVPLENLPDFRDWAAFIKVKVLGEGLAERRATEAQKLSAEFSKIIIINLQFINAGGLLAAPSISTNLLGLAGLPRSERLELIGLPMGMFALGLIAASIASFWAYRNYEMLANHWEADREWNEFNLGRLAPYLVQHNWEEKLSIISKKRATYQAKAQRRFWFSLISGWFSVLSFIIACGLLAWNAR